MNSLKKRTTEIWNLCNQKTRSFKELNRLTESSRATLANDLKLMLKQGTLKAETDLEDRRITLYKAVSSQKMETEVARYKMTDYITKMRDPIFDEKFEKIEGSNIGLAYFIEVDGPPLNNELKAKLIKRFRESMMEKWFKNIIKDWVKDSKEIVAKIGRSYKMVIVQTVHREKE